MLSARLCAGVRGKEVVGQVEGVEQMGVRVARGGREIEGAEGRRWRSILSAEALAMMCPTCAVPSID